MFFGGSVRGKKVYVYAGNDEMLFVSLKVGVDWGFGEFVSLTLLYLVNKHG